MKEVIDLIKKLTGKDAVVDSRLMGGMSNRTYIVTIDDKKHTFRIPGKKAETFVNRDIEKKCIEAVDGLNINNKTLLLDLEDGYKLAEFVEGTPLNELADLHLEEVATLLKTLHNADTRFENDYDPFGRLSEYELLNEDLSEEYFATRQKFFKHKEYLSSLPKVMAHGDSQKSNFVIGEKCYLLDWEFAGNNDFYYDIACFGNVDFNDAIQLLEVYLGHKPSDEELNRLTLWRTFQCLQWHNVALYKDVIGLSEELNVPFKAVAGKYLNLANELLSTLRK